MSGEGDTRAAVVRWMVSAFTTVSWRGEQVEIASAASGATLTTVDVDVVRLLHAFARPRTIAEVILQLGASGPERLTSWIDDFIRAGVLTSASAPELAATHHWDPSALAFHRRSRRRAFQKTPGWSTPVAAPRSRMAIPLARASVSAPRDLADVLDARRSWREWPAKSIPQETFSTLLWLSARNRELEGAPDEYVSRPYPSGGGAYTLELYPVMAPDAVESIAAGVYRYLPAAHSLEPVSHERAEYLPFLEAAARSAGAATNPPLVLIVTSRCARQGEEYGELAYSLVLKEVGCLFQTLYLVAEYLGLAPCALGGGTPAGRLARLCHTSELAEPVVGELVLGPRE